MVNINRIKEVVPWFKSSYQLRMDDRKQTEIPVSRAQTKRLRELFGLEVLRLLLPYFRYHYKLQPLSSAQDGKACADASPIFG